MKTRSWLPVPSNKVKELADGADSVISASAKMVQ